MASSEAATWVAAYFTCGLLVLWMQQGVGPSFWYPPIAIGMALLLRLGLRAWPLILIPDLLISFMRYGYQRPDAILVAGNSVLECVIAAWLLSRPSVRAAWAGGRELALRLGAIALLAAGAGATSGSLLLRAWGSETRPTLDSWTTWWISDAAGVLTLLPALVLSLIQPPAVTSGCIHRRMGESVALFTVTALVGVSHMFAAPGVASIIFSGLMLSVVPVLWAAIRYDLRTTARVLAVMSLTSVVGMRLQPDGALLLSTPFVAPWVVLQGNLVVLALAGFTLAPVLAAERRAHAELERLAGDLRLQVAHTRLAQRAGRTGSWECDPNGENALWSEELFEMFRVDPERGVPTFDALVKMVDPASRWVLKEARRAALEGRVHEVRQIRLCWPDGQTAWHEVRWETVSVAGRKRIVGTHTDVTQLMERRLVAEHLAAIVSATTEAIFTVDREHHIRTWNPAAERLFGWRAADAQGRSWFDLVPAARRPFKERYLQAAFSGERPEVSRAEMQTATGRPLVVRMSFSPVRDTSGRILEAAVVCGDLTRQRDLEEQLLQSQKMEVVGRLAGGVAHDFNNMLTAMLGFSEIVRTQVAADPVATKNIDHVLRAAERASVLTRRLLAFSGRQPRAAKPLELDAELQRMLPLFQRLVGEDLALELRPGAMDTRVLLDPTQFEQVVLNLVINARDAMPEGGSIVLETRALDSGGSPPGGEHGMTRGRTVVLTVRDTGIGMDEATRKRIFEPFFTTKEAGRGTGLGLSTVFSIVSEHQGVIRVESTPGQGTSFHIHLPECHDATVPRMPVEPPPSVATDGVETILVVEDESLVRDYLAACLRTANYGVHLAATAEQAVEWLAHHQVRVDLLVTDIVLPRMTGVELARLARELKPELPVVFLSGHSEAAFEDRLPGEFLTKPFRRDEFLRVVRRSIDSGRAAVGGR